MNMIENHSETKNTKSSYENHRTFYIFFLTSMEKVKTFTILCSVVTYKETCIDVKLITNR